MSLDFKKFEVLKRNFVVGSNINLHNRRNGLLEENHVINKTATYQALKNDNKTTSFIGIEIELENARVGDDEEKESQLMYWWEEKGDGSLRNNGTEFVTKPGITAATVVPLMLRFSEDLKAARPKAQNNMRTGLHVHFNVREMSYYELSNVLFLYAITEPAFFEVSGNRFENIFCVPWCENKHNLGEVINRLVWWVNRQNKPMAGGVDFRNYSKYCGLNLAAISTYGSLEFRQHKGTHDPFEIIKWVQTIEALFDVGKRTSLEGNIELFRQNRNDAKYDLLFSQIFHKYQKLDRARIIEQCRDATEITLSGFVDKDKLPSITPTFTPFARHAPIVRREGAEERVEVEGEWEVNVFEPIQNLVNAQDQHDFRELVMRR